MNNLYTVIYATAKQEKCSYFSRTSVEALKIDQAEIRFLLPPLLRFSQFLVHQPRPALSGKAPLLEKVWELRFFLDSAYQQTVFIAFFPSLSFDKQNIRDLKSTIFSRINKWWKEECAKRQQASEKLNDWGASCLLCQTPLTTINQAPATSNDWFYHTASLWLRESYSLTARSYKTLGSGKIAIDGRGLAFLALSDEDKVSQAGRNPKAVNQFERLLILQALAKSYQHIQQEQITELAMHCKNLKKVEALYRQTALFNARFFFSQPVNMSNLELPLVWDALRQRYRLSTFNKEIISQMNDVQKLLESEHQAQQSAREKIISGIVTLLGLFLSASTLLSLASSDPESFIANLTLWWQWLTQK
jgi:hypothetical protein